MGRRAVALLLLLTTLSGCWSRVELNDLGVVLGLAVDVGEQGKLRLTLYMPRQAVQGKQGGMSQPETVWVVAREAANLSDALAEIRMASSRQIVMYHLRAVVIGEEFARTQGVGDLLDVLATMAEVRLTLRPFVARGRAQEVLETIPQMRTLQPMNLTGILQSRGGRVEWRLKNVLVARVADTHSSWMHAVQVINRPAGVPGAPATGVELAGAALFRGDYLVRMLDTPEAQVLNWFLGAPAGVTISTACPDPQKGSISVRVDRGRLRIHPRLDGNKVSFRVRATADVNMNRTECGVRGTDAKDRQMLEERLADDLRQRIERLIAIFQDSGTDPVGFGKRLQLAYPEYFRMLGEDWKEVWPTASVEVATRITITRSGLTTATSTGTERELKERAR